MPRPAKWALSAAARRASRMRKHHAAGSGRPKILRPCPTCGTLLGAREARQHKHPALAP